jgi:hypothetical protein
MADHITQEQARDSVDEAEILTIKSGGGCDPLTRAVELLGFSSWRTVVHLARTMRCPAAIELLARRVERGL